MLDNYLLEELVTFAQNGTLAKTAALLNVTQPTVTRGMQKLEADLQVQLFKREPNRISLTKTGELAASEAAKLLQANQQLIKQIRNFDQNQTTLKIGAQLPGPLMLLEHLRPNLPQKVQLDWDFVQNKSVADWLTNRTGTLLFSNQALSTKTIEATYVGTEKLAVNLNKFMFQGNQKTISFKELSGISFLVLSAIGPWRTIIQQEIPKAKFLYQQQLAALVEITQYSDFPYFSTNLARFDATLLKQNRIDDNRVCIPLSDASAQMPIYAIYLKSQKQRVLPLIEQVSQAWPKTKK
ncbi:LysR family transcriptional regulator [Loigolactobacillus jiayinensis]|uniref:LysR family transcriptional regulator n=1 Tax=Loigolactobacillus jiayinensis TaxID=2486016 RepID=A0ABW1RGC1_9LACO|nr:LysR family transcriptional regulator [Loigolactobacillus jiayinensis]